MKKTALIIFTLLIFATTAFAARLGDDAPDFQLTSLSGKSLSSSAGTVGKKPILLFFWATW